MVHRGSCPHVACVFDACHRGSCVHIACVFAACSNMCEKDLSIFKPRLTGYHKGTICSQVFFSSPKSGYAPQGVFVVSYFFAQESGVSLVLISSSYNHSGEGGLQGQTFRK